MVAPPDSNNPSTTTPHDDDLTLNSVTSDADFRAVPDLSLKPDRDASTLAPEDVPPGVDIFVTGADEPDRSWLFRLRSLKTLWEKEHVRRRVRGEPAPIEDIRNLDRHLDSLAALREICAAIDHRLTRVEQANAQDSGAAIDEVLRDLCSQTSDRVARVEAALQHTEEFVAGALLREISLSIEKQLADTRSALQRTEEAVTDKTLLELCRNIDARLDRTDGTLHHSEDVVAAGLQELSGRMMERLTDVEETLRVTPKSVADRMLPNLERQLMQARMSLQRTEEAVTDRTLHELCQNIDARLERTEGRLDRSESLVAEGLHELSTHMRARFAETEEAIHRIERMVSSRAVEPTSFPQPSAPIGPHPVQAEARALRPRSITWPPRPLRLTWMAAAVTPALVLLCTLAVSSLIERKHVGPPDTAPPFAATEQPPAPSTPVVLPVTNERVLVPPVMASTPRLLRERSISPAPRRSTNREPAPTSARSPRFVGTLSITSVPSGASVLINGKPAGKTPLRLPRQRAGSLAVQIAHDGFERWSAAVLVPADQLTQVTARLRAIAR